MSALQAHRIASMDKSYDYLANVAKVLNSPGWASVTTDKLSLDDGDNRFYVLIDEQGRVYVAITSKAYPSRYIYTSTDGSTRGVLGGTNPFDTFVAALGRLSVCLLREAKHAFTAAVCGDRHTSYGTLQLTNVPATPSRLHIS